MPPVALFVELPGSGRGLIKRSRAFSLDRSLALICMTKESFQSLTYARPNELVNWRRSPAGAQGTNSGQ